MGGMKIESEAEGLQPVENQKSVGGCGRGGGVAQRSDERTPDEGGRHQGLGVDDAVIGRVGLVEEREAVLVGDPVELAAVDDHAAHGGAMPADIFCERVDDDVGAEVEGPAQKGWIGRASCRERVWQYG